MSRPVALSAIFLLAFAGFLVAGLPLSTALSLGGARERGLGYASASGTIWRGAVHGVRVAGQDVGEVSVQVSPLALLRGTAAVDFETRGVVRARARAGIDLAGEVQLHGATLIADTRDLRRLHPELATRGGEVFIRIDDATFDRSGACVSVSGVVQTDVLARGASETGWRGPTLDGEMTCAGGTVALAVNGSEAGTIVRVDALLSPQTGAQVTADVSTQSPEVAAALAYLGFEERDDVFSYAYRSGQDSAS